jgi:hypothetical protein
VPYPNFAGALSSTPSALSHAFLVHENDSGSDNILSIAPSNFSLVLDDQDARTSAHNDQSVEDVLLDTKVTREEAKRSRHPLFSYEDDLVSLQIHIPSVLRMSGRSPAEQVQDVMFTVHAHLFDSQSAQAFIERWRAAPDGVIMVKDVSALDLERYLTILYSKCIQHIACSLIAHIASLQIIHPGVRASRATNAPAPV